MKTIHLICAARPNFMKIAPLYHVLKNNKAYDLKIIHSGQHYDYQMSQTFFEDFELPSPDYYLDVGSGTHAEQIGKTMINYEKLCLEANKPDLVIVVGDVNATLACAITAKKLNLKVGHLEAGLRSFDMSMPEESNRLVTDAISDYHWTPSQDANDNLLREGIKLDQMSLVGNIMIDTYHLMQSKIDNSSFYKTLDLKNKEYVVLTLHRPINVDSKSVLENILSKLAQIEKTIVFPVHPRTQKTLNSLKNIPNNLKLIDPLNYISFMNLVKNSAFVISDSGGIQEETTYLGIPCFTLRDSTERPITVDLGTNQLVSIETLLERIQYSKQGTPIPFWDGKTAERIQEILQKIV